VIAPEGGWKEDTWYIVDVSIHPSNPIHRAMLYTGFIDHGEPGNYNGIFHGTYDRRMKMDEMRYVRAVREAAGSKEMRSSYTMPPQEEI